MPLHGDVCVRLQNAARARIRSVPIPSTIDNLSIVSILLQHGFIHNITRGTISGPSPTNFTTASIPARRLWVDLKYKANDRPVLESLNLISKPSRKISLDKDELLRFVTGRRAKFVTPLKMGEVGIVNTRLGWMEAREAIRRGTGGEVVARAS